MWFDGWNCTWGWMEENLNFGTQVIFVRFGVLRFRLMWKVAKCCTIDYLFRQACQRAELEFRIQGSFRVQQRAEAKWPLRAVHTPSPSLYSYHQISPNVNATVTRTRRKGESKWFLQPNHILSNLPLRAIFGACIQLNDIGCTEEK